MRNSKTGRQRPHHQQWWRWRGVVVVVSLVVRTSPTNNRWSTSRPFVNGFQSSPYGGPPSWRSSSALSMTGPNKKTKLIYFAAPDVAEEKKKEGKQQQQQQQQQQPIQTTPSPLPHFATTATTTKNVKPPAIPPPLDLLRASSSWSSSSSKNEDDRQKPAPLRSPTKQATMLRSAASAAPTYFATARTAPVSAAALPPGESETVQEKNDDRKMEVDDAAASISPIQLQQQQQQPLPMLAYFASSAGGQDTTEANTEVEGDGEATRDKEEEAERFVVESEDERRLEAPTNHLNNENDGGKIEVDDDAASISQIQQQQQQQSTSMAYFAAASGSADDTLADTDAEEEAQDTVEITTTAAGEEEDIAGIDDDDEKEPPQPTNGRTEVCTETKEEERFVDMEKERRLAAPTMEERIKNYKQKIDFERSRQKVEEERIAAEQRSRERVEAAQRLQLENEQREEQQRLATEKELAAAERILVDMARVEAEQQQKKDEQRVRDLQRRITERIENARIQTQQRFAPEVIKQQQARSALEKEQRTQRKVAQGKQREQQRRQAQLLAQLDAASNIDSKDKIVILSYTTDVQDENDQGYNSTKNCLDDDDDDDDDDDSENDSEDDKGDLRWIAAANAILTTDFGLHDPTLLTEDFRAVQSRGSRPGTNSLDKLEYVTAGQFFNLRSTFPDLDYRAHDFRVEQYPENTDDDDNEDDNEDAEQPAVRRRPRIRKIVRCTIRPVGTMLGPLQLRNQKLLPANGKILRGPPEAITMIFEEEEIEKEDVDYYSLIMEATPAAVQDGDDCTLQLSRLYTGYVLDRQLGNTQGFSGVEAAAIIAGVPASKLEMYSNPGTALVNIFRRPYEQIQDPATYLAPFPEATILSLARNVVSTKFGYNDPSILSEEDFIFFAPKLVSPSFGTRNFFEVFDTYSFVKFFQQIPESSFSNYRLDIYDPFRVWVDVNYQRRSSTVSRTNIPLDVAAAFSFSFDDEGGCTRITIAKSFDPSIGSKRNREEIFPEGFNGIQLNLPDKEKNLWSIL